MFPNDSIPLQDVHRVYNVVAALELCDLVKANKLPPIFCVMYRFSKRVYIPESLNTMDQLKAIMKEFDEEDGAESFEKLCNRNLNIRPADGKIVVALLMQGPRGSFSHSWFSFDRAEIPLFLGEQEESELPNIWFSEKILRGTFEKLKAMPSYQTLIETKNDIPFNVVRLVDGEQIAFQKFDQNILDELFTRHLVAKDVHVRVSKEIALPNKVLFIYQNYLQFHCGVFDA